MLIVDWCPIVLRLHLNKVFPVYHLNNADLSVITFSMKYNQERCRQNLESELEKTAQVVSYFFVTNKYFGHKFVKKEYLSLNFFKTISVRCQC